MKNGLKLEELMIQSIEELFLATVVYIYTHYEIGSLIKKAMKTSFDTDKWSRNNGFAIQALKKHDQNWKSKHANSGLH